MSDIISFYDEIECNILYKTPVFLYSFEYAKKV